MYVAHHNFFTKSPLRSWGGLLLALIASAMFLQYFLHSPAPAKELSKPAVLANLIKLPLVFEINKGQTASQVNYLSRGDGYNIFFTPKEIVLDFRKGAPEVVGHGKTRGASTYKASNDVLRMQFVGANTHPVIVGQDELPSKSNYFIGNNPQKWQKDVANYGKVNYQNLYPGIDMVFYGSHNQLEYDIRVAPGAKPETAQFHIMGAKNLAVNQQGDLVLTAPDDEKITMHKPVVYQMIQGVKHPVAGNFVLADNKQVGFQVGAYDKTQTLVIDPAITYSTYLGGSGGDNAALGITVNPDNLPPFIYVTGYTNSTDFPVVHAFQSVNKGPGRTAFVVKLSRPGNALVYSTYIGGSGGNDEGFAISVDGVTATYITGETNSKDFPLQNPIQSTNLAKDFCAFVTKLSPEGSALVYSTYLCGSGENQEGNAIDVDNQGFAYVTGETTSTDFPTKNPFQATNNGPKFTAFISKINTLGNDFVFSTYLGGSGGQDEGNGLVLDDANNIYVTGETNSKDFPTKNPIQAAPGPAGAGQTGFVTKMNSDGQSLAWSTYLGGSGGNDYPTSIAIDNLENIYVAGYTNSLDFPTVNPFQSTNNGGGTGRGFSGFLTKINPVGSGLVYSTYLGGSGGNDRITGVSVDPSRQAHVTGYTNSTNFPVLNPFQATNNGPGTTTFVTIFQAAGNVLQTSSYLGGSGGDDKAFGIVVDTLSNSYTVGSTNSPDFPLVNPLQATHPSAIMAFIANTSI